MVRFLVLSMTFLTLPSWASPINVALLSNGGSAQLSSLLGTFPQPVNLIDGNLSSSVSTIVQANAWAQVTFNDTYFVTFARVFPDNRDCCRTRVNNFSMFLYNANDEVVWSSTGNSIPVDAPEVQATFSGINTWGNRMRMQLEHSQNLSMQEFEVFADLGAPSSEVPEPSTYLLTGIAFAVLGRLKRRGK
ncbi:MAG: PEP-CTERM sorting domain-containing protein [Acidobacteria bacterium]|nr:PEP-CTERM sorting domain-containing protein [Acidobacteriota bacterium]